jgi:NADPH:quinone reductase-like Zn-dependent oxidoreductase
LPKLPAILGREVAGRVEDVGEGVSSVKVFERQLILLEMY